MNIVLFASSYAPRVGGLETAVARLAREYRGLGHRVTVVTNRYPRSLPRFEYLDGIAVYRILFPAPLVPHTEWKRTHMGKFLALLPLAPWALLRLWLTLRALRPDVVNVHYLSSPAFYIGALGQLGLLRARLVVSFHGSDLTTVPYPTGSPAISRWIVGQAQAVTACSADLARYVTLMTPYTPGGSVHVVYNGTDPHEFDGAVPYVHPRPYLFTAGRLVEKKGMHFLIEALDLVRQRGIECDLLIAGSGPEEDALRALATRLGLEGHIHFVGSADRGRLGSLYHGCALFTLAPVWEGFGIVSLEAMSCGRAVVAARTGGIPEVVVHGETGLLARAADPADLADRLMELLTDPKRAEQMGRLGRERVAEHFTWPAVAARYLASYSAQTGEDGPAPPRHPGTASSAAVHRESRRLDDLAAEAGTLLEADYAGIALHQPDGSTVYRGTWGTRSEVPSTMRFPSGRGFPSLVAAAGHTLVATNIGKMGAYRLDEMPWHMSEGGRAALGTPLLRGGRAIGALVLGWRSDTVPSGAQVTLAETLARQIAGLCVEPLKERSTTRSPSAGTGIPILTYHQVAPDLPGGVKRSLLVTPQAFATQMRLLHRLGWRTMRLVELIAILDVGAEVPTRRFVLTFDDAFQGVLEHAAPVLQDLGFTATIFVPTALVGTCRALDGGADTEAKRLMSWDDLRALRARGFDIGGHTRTHPHLPALSPDAAAAEIRGAREDIAAQIGEPPLTFAYPYGEWNPAVASLVHEAGYMAACTTRLGRTTIASHRFALPRLSISADLDPPHFLYRFLLSERIARRIAARSVAGGAAVGMPHA